MLNFSTEIAFANQPEEVSVRQYTVDLASRFFDNALANNVSAAQINPGFSKQSISLLAHQIFDSAIDYAQISEQIINLDGIPDSVADKVRQDGVFLIETATKNKLADSLGKIISFDASYNVDHFMKDAHYSDVFDEDLLDMFIDMGKSVADFQSLSKLPTEDSRILDLTHKILIETRELMYGKSSVNP